MLLCRSDKKTDSDSSDDDSEKSKLKHQLEGELPHTLCVCARTCVYCALSLENSARDTRIGLISMYCTMYM